MRDLPRETRVVSMRDLSRRTASLLDQIEHQGSALVVVRYGRPAAVVVPFLEGAGVPKLPRVADFLGECAMGNGHRGEQRDEELEGIELDENAVAVLKEIVDTPAGSWSLNDAAPRWGVTAVRRAIGKLDIECLVEPGAGSIYRASALGERYVERLLDSEA